MTKNAANNGSLGSYKMVWLAFNDRERDRIIEYYADRKVDFTGLLEQQCSDGWKVSISFSSGWDNFVLSITPKEVKNFHKGLVFLFRHENFGRIVEVCDYFFAVMVENQAADLVPKGEGHDW